MDLTLPKRIDGSQPHRLPCSSQITLIGANGSGKTRFMNDIISRCSNKAYVLSAMKAFYPEKELSPLEGSIDMLYAMKVKTSSHLKDDALSEIDKLAYMLFNDEFEYLLSVKAKKLIDGVGIDLKPTKLDKLVNLWQQIFPGNQILRETGKLMFMTESGDNLISSIKLSSGEKAVLYYIAAVLYAMPDAVIFIDSPTLFMHPSILNTVWNAIEDLRPDCTFIYNTYDVDFVNSRTENVCVWIKSYSFKQEAWDYEVLNSNNLSEDLFIDLMGSRKPVMFIEGDAVHSIDAKLYPLVFPEYTVRPLGSCNKVIESTRTFNDLCHLHHLDSHGIVDRDRRTDSEVKYLRNKNIFVPDVAEIENIFLLEGVIKTMAKRRGKDPEKVFSKVKKTVLQMFASMHEQQVLLHVRHKVKRDVECKIDAKFSSINQLENHLRTLINKINPREIYNQRLQEFKNYINYSDYANILKVFNHKPMLSDSNVAGLLGYSNKESYITGVLNVLKGNGKDAKTLRNVIQYCFGIISDNRTLDTMNNK